ncbi:hypothetical protein [Kocuria sp. U4B]
MATTAAPQLTHPNDRGPDSELPLHRLHLMRAGYALMGVGLMIFRVPDLFVHEQPWPLKESVVVCMLTAMAVLALLGLRYPVKLIPILLFEVAWKLTWLPVVALPKLLAGEMDTETMEVLVNCTLVVIIIAVIPWGYVWRHYLTATGDRWR